jgi:hypothetical protein
MSQNNVEDVLKRLSSDSEFRKKVKKDPSATLDKEYPKLGQDEKEALKNMVIGFAADLKEGRWSWLKPTSFKEFGGALLSAALVGLLIVVAHKTFAMMNVLPQAVDIGSTVQVVDTYARSRDLLSTLFPLFAAVVTFWLGVAVEGKRADQNKETAEKSSAARTRAALEMGAVESPAKSLVTQLQAIRKTLGGKAEADPSRAGLDAAQSLADEMVSSLEKAKKVIVD